MRSFVSLFLILSMMNLFSGESSVISSITEYKAKDFSYLLGKTPGFSDKLLNMHFTLYAGYVKNTNELSNLIEKMRDNGEEKTLAFGALKRRFGWEFDGMRLHELYFENLSGAKPLADSSFLYQRIVREFGSYALWQKDFIATGLMRGIGWVILYQDKATGKLFNVWIEEHDLGHLAGGVPLVVMDVWEHAYITEYGLDRASYINNFFNVLNWDVVKARFSN